MAKKMLIDATHAEETRVVVVDGNKVEEFDFESENKRQLAGNIYLAKISRVEPSLQAAFVEYGGNRHGFLAFTEIHPDYYQIPVADREALIAEERAYAEQQAAEEDEKPKRPRRRRGGRTKSDAAAPAPEAAEAETVTAPEPAPSEIGGMEVVDLPEEDANENAELSFVDGPVDAAEISDQPVEAAEPATETGESAEEAADETKSDETKSVPMSIESDDAQVSRDPENPDAGDKVVEPQETAPVDAQAVEAEPAAEEASAADSDQSEASDVSNDDADSDGDDDNDGHESKVSDASERDDQIESVAEEDVAEEIRPTRKPRPRRYKIQEVIKVRQILLVQVVKEERGNKGAALTTYLSLAGRYCVLMPNTARGGGISRKITNAPDRKKLKEIANEIDVPDGAGLIIRTAGAKRTKSEVKRDYEYLQRLWEQIRELTLKSIAPAKIYEEGDLIKRSIRDLYSREIDEVLVEGEGGYRTAKDFMKMIMPSHAKNVKLYQDQMPLFARHQVESYLSAMFNPTVQLKSGGYIVIGVTEALVAIDVNSGRATKEGSIEDTALKTNLEAAEEVARQLRLRDLAGLIVIDFIDMEERRNNSAVEKRFKDKLKTDRARIQVGRISGFGLMEMSRQRLRPGMIEATTQPCHACHGTGLVRSDDNLALTIIRQLEEEGTRRKNREVLVKAPVGIVNYLINQKREHIAQIEARYGMSVRIEGDPFMVSPDFVVEKFKTATRVVHQTAPVVSVDASMMAEVDEDEAVIEAEAEVEVVETEDTGDQPKKRRRRRRRRRGGGGDGAAENADEARQDAARDDTPADVSDGTAAPEDSGLVETPEGGSDDEKPKRRRRRRGAKKDEEVAAPVEATDAVETADAPTEVVEAETADAPTEEPVAEEKPKRKRAPRTRKKKDETADAAVEATAEATTDAPTEDAPVKEKPKRRSRAKAKPEVAEEPAPAAEPTPEPAPEAVVAEPEAAESAEAAPEPATAPEPEMAPEPESPPKPKKRGWWSLGR